MLICRLDILRANGCLLALELSRNELEVRKVENDGERSTMRFLQYKSKREALQAEKRKLTMADRDELAKNETDDKVLKRCLQSEDVVDYWWSLTSVAVHGRFLNTTHFSSKWSDKTIHQPGGGVSN